MSDNATQLAVSPVFSDPREVWYTPPPKSGKHGGPFARLFRPQPFELGYLSWGRRHYGEPPLPERKHEGWHYFVVLSGSPTLVVADELVHQQAGSASLGDPNCPIGHWDQPGRACQILTWIWRSPPTHSALRPAPGSRLNFVLQPDQLRRLRQLHQQCRDAVADSNERSMLQLRAARIMLDLCFLESLEHQAAADTSMRINLAIQYLRNHVGKQTIMRDLCEYLQVSKASLYRLFHEHTGKGPRAYAQHLRMQWAREQLSLPNRSVKSVAYELGYRHPPDFSRAFKLHFGISATDAIRKSELR